MTLDEIRDRVIDGERSALLKDNLTAMLWDIGTLLDIIDEVDPAYCRGEPPRLGTPNHRSMTYRLRKVAGYSYP